MAKRNGYEIIIKSGSNGEGRSALRNSVRYLYKKKKNGLRVCWHAFLLEKKVAVECELEKW